MSPSKLAGWLLLRCLQLQVQKAEDSRQSQHVSVESPNTVFGLQGDAEVLSTN